MSVPLVVNGITFNYPVDFDTNWGVNATGWAQAVTSGMLQKAGGSFPLTADVDFGPTFGLKSPYYKSENVSIATTGVLRLGATDVIAFGTSNYPLTTDGSGNLTWRGDIVATSTGDVTSIIGTANQVIASSPTGNVTLSLPQSIALSSSPTFASETLTNTTNQLILGTTNTTTLSATAPAASRVITFSDPLGNDSVAYLAATQTLTNKTLTSPTLVTPALGMPTSGDLTNCTNIPVNQAIGTLAVAHGGTGQISYTDGQLLIGNTATTSLSKSTLTGTTNQVIVTNGNGSITLSLPQSINTGATPTFAALNLTNTTNQLVLGTTNTTTISSIAPTASRTYTLPDAGASANIVLDEGNYTIGGTWSFNNNITLASSKELILTDNTTNTVAIKATNSTTSWTLSLPTTHGLNTQVLTTDGSGNTSWQSQTGSGTVNAGTATHLAYYATSANAVSDANGASVNGSYTFTGGAGAITMSSSTIAMGSNKITGLANGTASSDAMAYGQFSSFLNAAGYIKGTIIQRVTFSTTSIHTGSSSTFTATNLTANITPLSSTSIIRITANGVGGVASGSTAKLFITIQRGATNLLGSNGGQEINFGSNVNGSIVPVSLTYDDSPASISSLTYAIYMAVSDNSTNCQFGDTNVQQYIRIEEIAN